MKKIPLGNGKFATIDDSDYEALKGFNWRYQKSVNGSSGYAVATIKMHRLITKAEKGEEIDHINRRKLDNRRKNLRLCTHSQNVQNRPPNIRNKSGYRGVYWHAVNGKWATKVGNKHLGCFETKEDAAREYNRVAKREYEKFAYINILST